MRLLACEIALWAAIIFAARLRIKSLMAGISSDQGSIDDDQRRSLLRKAVGTQGTAFAAVIAVNLLFVSKTIALGSMFTRVEFAALMLATFLTCIVGYPLKARVQGLTGSPTANIWFIGRIMAFAILALFSFHVVVSAALPIAWSRVPSFQPGITQVYFFGGYLGASLVAVFALGALAADIAEFIFFRLVFAGRRIERPELATIVLRQFRIAKARAPELRAWDVSGIGFHNFVMTQHPFFDPVFVPRIFIDSHFALQPVDVIEPMTAVLAAMAARRQGLDRIRLVTLLAVVLMLPLMLILHEIFLRLGWAVDSSAVFNLALLISGSAYFLISVAWNREKILIADSDAIGMSGIVPEALVRSLEGLAKKNDSAGTRGLSGGEPHQFMMERIERLRSGRKPQSSPSLIRAVWRGRWKWAISVFFFAFAAASGSFVDRHVRGKTESDVCRDASGHLVPIKSLRNK